ncbi:MAG: metallophosphoesterase [Candidatus Caldarchaeum sp.]|nr:metallophosphoesterase [Candidatus Caldarchaeum sp.]
MKLVEGHAALLLEKPVRMLAVADLHLGFEEELRSKGVKVPLQSPKIVEELASLAEEQNARKIIVVGDLKHNIRGASPLEYEILPRMLKPLKRVVDEIIVIPGNHDGKISKLVAGLASVQPLKGYLVLEEKTGFTHGHVKPDKKLLMMDTIVIGHFHPVLKIGVGVSSARMGVWLRLRGDRRMVAQSLFKTDFDTFTGEINLLVMPSFNRVLQGRSVVEISEAGLSRGPLLRSKGFDIRKAEVIGLDGTYIGTLGELGEILR